MNQEKIDSYEQFNAIARNICTGQLMKGNVQAIKIFHTIRFSLWVSYSSIKQKQKIYEGSIFKSTIPLQYTAKINNKYYKIEFTAESLEKLQEDIIQHFQEQKCPLESIELALSPFR